MATADSRAAFNALFDDCYSDLVAYAVRRCQIRSDADDLVAETFATAWRRIHAVPAGEDGRRWLFGVARNLLQNQRRTQRRWLRLREKIASEPPLLPTDPANEDADDRVARAITELSARDREVLLLTAWEGLAADEIAEILDISITAVWKRLQRARDRLARQLPADLRDRTPSAAERSN